MTLRSRGAGRGEGVPRGRGGGINGGEERRRRRRWWRRRRQSRRRWRGVQPVSLVLAVPRPPLCPTTGIHLPFQPVPSVSLHRRRPGVGDNLALAPSLPAGTAEEGRGRSRPRTRLRPRPARLLACSPARPLARSLARSPRFHATKKSDHPLACTTCPTRFALRASVLAKGGERRRARSRTGVPINALFHSTVILARLVQTVHLLSCYSVLLLLDIGVWRRFRVEFLWIYIYLYMYIFLLD